MHTATYSCSSGFAVVGDSTRECVDTGLWSGDSPDCVGELEGLVKIGARSKFYLSLEC